MINFGNSFSNTSNHLVEYQKLNDMVDYCNTDKCLRKYILEYFGEKPIMIIVIIVVIVTAKLNLQILLQMLKNKCLVLKE